MVQPPNKPINKVALALRADNPLVVEATKDLIRLLREHNTEIFYLSPPVPGLESYDFPQIEEKHLATSCQVILVVGGDGTFIRHSIVAAKAGIPILGINCGRVGFLTEVARTDIGTIIPDILQGRYFSSTKTLMSGKVCQGETITELLSVNDLVVQSLNGRVLEINLSVDGKFVYCERTDGIIVATSAGSSAYALSAGGPLIVPEVDALEVVNISPTTLTSRPLVLPSSARITIELVLGDEVAVYADGGDRVDISRGSKVQIEKDALSVPLIHHESYEIFSAYSSKLGWHSQGSRS